MASAARALRGWEEAAAERGGGERGHRGLAGGGARGGAERRWRRACPRSGRLYRHQWRRGRGLRPSGSSRGGSCAGGRRRRGLQRREGGDEGGIKVADARVFEAGGRVDTGRRAWPLPGHVHVQVSGGEQVRGKARGHVGAARSHLPRPRSAAWVAASGFWGRGPGRMAGRQSCTCQSARGRRRQWPQNLCTLYLVATFPS